SARRRRGGGSKEKRPGRGRVSYSPGLGQGYPMRPRKRFSSDLHVLAELGVLWRPVHTGMLTSSKAPLAAARASPPVLWRASSRASRKLSSSSSRVWPWELIPETSSTQPVHHSPCCWMTAV